RITVGFTQINVTFFAKGQQNSLVDPATAFRLALLLARFARPAKVRLRKHHFAVCASLRMTHRVFVSLFLFS
ncbi:MAG: hypothetical protein IJX13_01805, partial [Clostridia bacterium]|nr:hypothetical protein [Clostridia bacterium]